MSPFKHGSVNPIASTGKHWRIAWGLVVESPVSRLDSSGRSPDSFWDQKPKKTVTALTFCQRFWTGNDEEDDFPGER